MSQGVHLRKYGAATNINFDLYEVDGVNLRTDAVSAAGDGKIMKDNGAEANTATTTFVDEGQGYSQALSATEMQAARIVLYFVDSATKVWLDKVIIIETYGNASAQHAFDLDTASTAQTGDSFARLGTAGAGLTDITLNAASIDLVWDELLAGHVTADSAGLVLNEWQNGGRLDLILDTLALETTVAALNNISTANVLTQVNTALDTTIAELGVAAPAVTPTLRTGLMLLYMLTRNKLDVQTSGTDALEVHNDAGTEITSKLITDAGGDYSEAKMS